jgi:predicted outer membrane repeat protein
MKRKLFLSILILSVLLGLTLITQTSNRAVAAGPLCYVDDTALGTNDGSSWTDAFTDLQSALNDMGCTHIEVAQGTYAPTTAPDRTATFLLRSGVEIYGGYPDGGGTRDPSTYVTILSGDIGVPGDHSDNSYHVVTGSWVDFSAVLDGFTIEAGNADGEGSYGRGGGVYSDFGYPILQNLVISENYGIRGGGIYIINASPILSSLAVQYNSAAASGGGMYLLYSNPDLSDIVFRNNIALDPTSGGGGLSVANSRPHISWVEFSGNTASYGGGMICWGSGNPPILVIDSTFQGNDALLVGGGLYLNNCDISLDRVSFNQNTASTDGGGIYSENSDPNMSMVTFDMNQANGAGGGFYSTSSNATIHDSTFTSNHAEVGGGLYSQGRVTMVDSILDQNHAEDEGGGIFLKNAFSTPNPHILVQITGDWFEVQQFAPNAALSYWIYDIEGGSLLMDPGTDWTNTEGYAVISVGDQVDLEPPNHIVVSDGTTTKSITLEALTFDLLDLTTGHVEGTAPGPFGREVRIGINYQGATFHRMTTTDEYGDWTAEFNLVVPAHYGWAAAQVFDGDGDASEVRLPPRSLKAGNFFVQWSQTNPEEIYYLSWKGSANLTKPWVHPACNGDSEFFGNSWVSENEGTESFFFNSLVGWGTTGTWSSRNIVDIDIGSISSGCPGSADIPVHTTYQFFADEMRANLIKVDRTFEFGDTPYTHDVRPFIPRLFPLDGFSQVVHPDASGESLVTETTDGCGYGCMREDWNSTWFAIHSPITGLGMIVQHVPSTSAIALWIDEDGGSFTNSSSVLLLQPSGGFTGPVTETEYLCFYDQSIWMPSLTLPRGCQWNIPTSHIVASAAGDWFWTSDFIAGAELTSSIYESEDPGAELLWSGTWTADDHGYIFVGYSDHNIDLLPGHYLVVSDVYNEKAVVLENITMEVFDVDQDFMAGTAPTGRTVWAAAGYRTFNQRKSFTPNPGIFAWYADFKTISFDITEGMRPWSFAHIYDEDGDANEAGTPPPPPPPTGTTYAGSSFTNLLITGNSAANGSGIANFDNSEPVFVNATIYGNHASSAGSAIYNSDSSPILTNSIVWGNTETVAGPDIVNSGPASLPAIASSILEEGCPSGATCSGIIISDPLFVDAANDNLRLQAASPAIDAGNIAALPADTFDLDGDGDAAETIPYDLTGNRRIVLERVDLGAYEAQLWNINWTEAAPLPLVEGLPDVHSIEIDRYLDRMGQSRWFKFTVKPDSKVIVTLTGLPANYDLTLYKDIAQAYDELTSPQDLVQLSAEFAPDTFSPDTFSPDTFSPDTFSSGHLLSGHLLSGYVFSRHLQPGHLLSGYLFAGHLQSGYVLSGHFLTRYLLSGHFLSRYLQPGYVFAGHLQPGHVLPGYLLQRPDPQPDCRISP